MQLLTMLGSKARGYELLDPTWHTTNLWGPGDLRVAESWPLLGAGSAEDSTDLLLGSRNSGLSTTARCSWDCVMTREDGLWKMRSSMINSISSVRDIY